MNYFDLHCDTISECYGKGQPLYNGNLRISLERGRKYSPWFQCFALWISDDKRGRDAMDSFDALLDCFHREMEKNADAVVFCRTAADLKAVREQKKTGAILTVEGGAAAGGSLDRLKYMADCGVKVITLTWNASGDFGDGAGVPSPKGITEFGRLAVKEMERLHIAVDVSHASEKLFYDVAACTEKPFIATHSNARALCDHPRNLTDEQFQVIRDRGGLVGVTFVPKFLNASGKAGIDDVIRHIDHFLSFGGEKCLAFGSDFDGADVPGGITGIESVEAIAERMLRHNYRESLVNALLFENAYQFFLSL